MMGFEMGRRPVPARNVSAWTTSEKIARISWAVLYRPVFALTLPNWYAVRAAMVRLFGGKLGRNVRLRRSVRIEAPWNLRIADDVSVGDEAILYALGIITIGARTSISQYSHLCAGTHDYTRDDYPLLRLPITIGEDCWIAADVFIGPDVTIGDRAVVGARASVFTSLPGDMLAVGNPAKPIKPRPFARVEERPV
jgi:putative colanic acid biosynthesis acetyltransferase WcaF